MLLWDQSWVDGEGYSTAIDRFSLYEKLTSTAEVLLLENEVAVFRSGTECKFYIAGPVEEVNQLQITEE